jgi:microcystin-dependent protein
VVRPVLHHQDLSVEAVVDTRIDISFVDKDNRSIINFNQPNTMRVGLQNQSGGVVVLKKGTPVSRPTGDEFVLQLFFDDFFIDGSVGAKNIEISAEGWDIKYLDDPEFPAWGISPKADIQWSAAQLLKFSVTGLTPTVAPGTRHILIDVYGLPDTDQYTVSLPVSIQSTDQGKNLREFIVPNCSPATVSITRNQDAPVSCGFKLNLTNASGDPLVSADWEGKSPRFDVTFAYASKAPGYFALTSPTRAAAIKVTCGEATTGWGVDPQSNTAGMFWSLTPDQALNPHIIGAGGTASFIFSGIITDFAEQATVMMIQYSDVPGYKDGYISVVIYKVYDGLTVVNALHANSSSLVLSPGGSAPVASLNWEVKGATAVELSGVGGVPEQGVDFKVPITQTTSFVLTAYDLAKYQIATSRTVVEVKAPQSTDQYPVPAIIGQGVPVGAIVPWAGSLNNVPAGFRVCDGGVLTDTDNKGLSRVIGTRFGTAGPGTFKLPDLRNLFVVGTNGDPVVGASGTSSHGHNLTNMPAPAVTVSEADNHSHSTPSGWYGRGMHSGGRSSVDTNGNFNDNKTFQGAGKHSHGASVNFTQARSGDVYGGLRPIYFSLCYLIRADA